MARTFTVAQLRTKVRERADIVNAMQRYPDAELNGYISGSYCWLYDLLIRKSLNHFESTQTISATAGVSTYALPSDYYGTLGIDYLIETNRYAALVELMTTERNRFSLNTGGRSQAYRVVGNDVVLYPTPDSTQTYRHLYIPAPANLEGQYATATITCCAKSLFGAAETLTLNDGWTTYVFEFDKAGDGVVGGRIQVNISGDTTAIDVAATLTDAINDNATIKITARDNRNGTVFLQNDVADSRGNTAISDTVAETTFIVPAAFTGGSPTVADDVTIDGISGWEELVIIDAAIKCLRKEESDTRPLEGDRAAIIDRIEQTAEMRAATVARHIVDVQSPYQDTYQDAATWMRHGWDW